MEIADRSSPPESASNRLSAVLGGSTAFSAVLGDAGSLLDMACIVIPESGSIKGEYPLFRARNRPADLYARSAIVAVDIRSGLQEVEPFMAGENRRLSDGEAGEMRTWVVAANDWSEAAQSVVGSATGLATASRELADRLSGNGNGSDVEFPLPEELRKLAERVEGDSVELRDRYLATAACIEEFSDFIE